MHDICKYMHAEIVPVIWLSVPVFFADSVDLSQSTSDIHSVSLELDSAASTPASNRVRNHGHPVWSGQLYNLSTQTPARITLNNTNILLYTVTDPFIKQHNVDVPIKYHEYHEYLMATMNILTCKHVSLCDIDMILKVIDNTLMNEVWYHTAWASSVYYLS